MSFGRDYPEDYTTVTILFTTHDSNGAPVAPLTGYEAADVTIYKNGATAKTTTNGITMTSPLNSKTGLHAIIIDTSNDTGDSGFWTSGGGSIYTVVLDPDTETVNGQTTRKVIGDFTIAVSPVNWGRVSAPTTTVGLSGTTVGTVTTVTNQLTTAQIATGVWQDTTSGDFTVSSSIGKSLYTSGNAPGAASGIALVGSNMGTISGALTAAQIATGVWTDTTAGDFTTSASIGKSVMNGVALGTGLTVNDITTKTGYSLTQSFPSNFSSLGITAGGHITTVDTVTTVTNQLTAAAIATGVWTDTTAGDFTTSLSIGKSIMNGVSLGTGLTVANVSGNVTFGNTSIATVTNLTNLPAITAGWLTATGIAASALNGKGDWNIGKTGYALTAGYDPAKTAAQAGDAMTLTAAYDAAKTAATQASVNALPTTSSVMSADIKKVNGVTVNGDGSATPWGP